MIWFHSSHFDVVVKSLPSALQTNATTLNSIIHFLFCCFVRCRVEWVNGIVLHVSFTYENRAKNSLFALNINTSSLLYDHNGITRLHSGDFCLNWKNQRRRELSQINFIPFRVSFKISTKKNFRNHHCSLPIHSPIFLFQSSPTQIRRKRRKKDKMAAVRNSLIKNIVSACGVHFET